MLVTASGERVFPARHLAGMSAGQRTCGDATDGIPGWHHRLRDMEFHDHRQRATPGLPKALRGQVA